MAIGLARMFGVKLPANFNSPYKSTSIIDFWRRWHMTLSRFLRDYLYVPLGGNRKGSLRRYLNLMITMLLGGLWHGAGWTYVAWGGLHGLYLLANHGWRNLGSGRSLPSGMASYLARRDHGLGVLSRERFCECGEHRERPVRAQWRGRSHSRRQEGDRPPARCGRTCRDRAPAQLPTDHAALHAGLGPVEPPSGLMGSLVWTPSRATAALGAAAIIAVVLFSWGTTEFLYFQF